MLASMIFLGIESSCDDTCAAVVSLDGDKGIVRSSVVQGQTSLHADFGGVVPEIAARAHAEHLDRVVRAALVQADVGLEDLDGIAVTSGPGLIGGLVAGVAGARGIAAGARLPLYGINHLAGHALTPRLTHGVAFPYLMLLVSGGHCQILLVEGPDTFKRLGTTIDDAPGEAFDKTARLLGLAQPGGPAVEHAARNGNEKRFAFPRPLLDRAGMDMSFSGLKTALLRARDGALDIEGRLSQQDCADLCAGFQAAVADVLVEKTARAIDAYLQIAPRVPVIAVAGGVAANGAIRAGLEHLASQRGLHFVAPPMALCTDNAAMIAWAGMERAAIGLPAGDHLTPRPRWPLDATHHAGFGGGKKGAKA
ncbi:MAG: tRNA (adenosine(37)-N6)-threonylcarbamoyltransferase complex transferase subunit TsaD [Pseudomonadota bacterium]